MGFLLKKSVKIFGKFNKSSYISYVRLRDKRYEKIKTIN